MANGKRPLGLTALAIGNFIIGAVSAASAFALYAVVKMANQVVGAMGAKGDIPGTGKVYAVLAIAAVATVSLLVAGYGYIKQRKLGRIAGNAYAFLGLLNTVLALTVLNAKFGFTAVIGIAWPLVTAGLINTAFRDNLVA